MPSINMLKQTGEKGGKLQLDDTVFAVEYNEPLIHQVIVAQLNNARQGTKSTLTRAEVRGGGIKPWRQKGTGRARQGSIRSPQWKGGGVVFAPKPRDFSQKVNKKAKEAALKSALSQKLADGEIMVLESITLAAPKTKEVSAMLKNLSLNKKIVKKMVDGKEVEKTVNKPYSVLLVVTDKDGDVVRAASNLPNVTTIDSTLINVYDVVSSARCLFTKDSVKKIEEAYKG